MKQQPLDHLRWHFYFDEASIVQKLKCMISIFAFESSNLTVEHASQISVTERTTDVLRCVTKMGRCST